MGSTDFIEKEISEIKKDGLFRTLKAIEEGLDVRVNIKGKKLINFCSNDYLGLSSHPKVIDRAIDVLKKYGVGAGASRLVSGNYDIHEELESKISEYEGTEASIVFPSGYMANMGTIQALAGKSDTVILDRLDHASIIDGARLSGAKIQVYPHRDLAALQKVLERSRAFKRILIVTDHVFSMDGDIAPIEGLLSLADEYGAMIMIDTAHSTGVLPLKLKNIGGRSDIIIMGTLSKAIGSLGGFVSGTREMIEYLRNKARTFIFTTALPPAITAASIASFEIIKSDDSFRSALWDNVGYIKEKLKEMALDTMDSETQIMPVMIGDAKKALKAAEKLFDGGILLTAIRPPTVHEGTSRLRLTVTARHSREDIELLISKLSEIKPEPATESRGSKVSP